MNGANQTLVLPSAAHSMMRQSMMPIFMSPAAGSQQVEETDCRV
jgi:hypothetical protein